MFKLLASVFKRIVTAVTNPFRVLLVRIQRAFNINVITAKLIPHLTKKVKELITLKPQSRNDYFVIGRWWVYKKLFLTIILALCAGVFIYFNMFASKLPAAVTAPVSVTTDVTYDYNDMELQKFSGVANIRAADGKVVYTGDIQDGVCEGNGTLWNREGKLLYKGGFSQNQYSGKGISYYPDGTVKYEGEWAANLYEGEGRLYSPEGKLMYEGNFSNGKYEGKGKVYADNKLLYEGEFSSGLYHGQGTSYYDDGVIHYKGEFYLGKPQGVGQLYSPSGKLLYTGDMQNGEINYRSLVYSNYADIRKAFAETPRIFYSDTESAFVFEQAGVIITLDCRVKVDTWEKPTQEDDNQKYYYMPGENGSYSTDTSSAAWYSYDTFAVGTSASGNGVPASALYLQAPIQITPMAWYVVDSSSSSSSSSQSSSSSSSSSSSTQSSSSSSSSDSSSESPNTVPDSSSESSTATTPDFIEKNQTLYFEIDPNVWQSEKELEAEKIQVKKVTVFSGFSLNLAANAVEYTDNLPPSIEDCVAIDFIRQKQPTAFAQISFEMDRTNRLFMYLYNINNAARIERRVYLVNDLTYRYCYQKPEDTTPMYFSVER